MKVERFTANGLVEGVVDEVNVGEEERPSDEVSGEETPSGLNDRTLISV